MMLKTPYIREPISCEIFMTAARATAFTEESFIIPKL